MRSLLLVISVSGLFACAPSNARQVRQDLALTVGYPGASYHPGGTFALGATGNYVPNQKTTVDNSKTGMDSVISAKKDENPEDKREVVSTSYWISPFVQYFPFDSSAFFVGAAATINRSYYKFEEETVDSTTLNPQYGEVNYETKSTYVGVPIGFAWIWESGFSLTLDVGPRARVARTSEVSADGSSSYVSSKERDKTIETIDSLEPRYSWGGSGLIGWSF
jgi:hypothetical protein